MKIIKCDRCGEIIKNGRLVNMELRMQDEDFMYATNSSVYRTITVKLNNKDLCEKCVMDLSREFFKQEGEE